MLKTIFGTIFVLAIAFGGGIWFTDYALDQFGGFGELKIGNWSAYPDAGTAEADPYVKARAARQSWLPPGPTEGLIFYARQDSEGHELRRGCNYLLKGSTPSSRFWSLYVADNALKPIEPRKGLPPALHSREIVYNEDSNILITIGAEASPGNWLPIEGSGAFVLVMTFYDSMVASSMGLSEFIMPQLERAADQGPSCNV